jgi:hypothetical protein
MKNPLIGSFYKELATLSIMLLTIPSLLAQENELLGELMEQNEEATKTSISAFKSSRVILGPSTVQLSKRELQFRVSHLFGRVSDGIEELYGLDQMYNVDISFEYGISDQLSASLARSNDFDKTLQFSLKQILLNQSNDNALPYVVSVLGGINIRTKDYEDNRPFEDRLEYVLQLLASGRFSDQLAYQISPGLVRLNRVPTKEHPHTVLSTTLGVSYSISPSSTLNAEYVYILPTFDDFYSGSKNSLSLGMDIETGGHVFQVFISNATRLQTSGYHQMWENDSFFDGDIHIGFSIMRSFSL